MTPNKIIIIPGFQGGIADSLYDDLSRQTYQSAQDLAVYDDLKTLMPVYPAFTDVALPTQFTSPGDITVVNFKNFIKTSDGYYFLGTGVVAATTNTILYKAGSLVASPSWTKKAGSNGDNSFCGIAMFKDGLYFQIQNSLKRYGDLSGSQSLTTAGSLSDNTERFGDIIAHKALGRVYFAHGINTQYKVGWYDGTTFTEGALNIGVGLAITNLDQAGNFVLVGVRPVNDSSKSYIIVWNGSAATIEDIIEVGDVGLQGFRNHGGIIEAITTGVPTTTAQFTQRIFRGGLGSDMQLDREIKGLNSNAINANAITVSGNGLFIGFANANIYTMNSKDHKIPEFLSDFRSLSPTAQAAGNTVIKSIRDTGSEIVVNWTDTTSGSVEHIYVTGGVQATPSTGVYESNVFPLNGGLPDKIKRIILNHKGIPTSCGFTVQIKQLANYPWGSTVPSLDTYQDLLTPEGSGSSTGKTQSTNNACVTEIAGNELFKECRYAQIKIKFDEVTTTAFASIVFPIIIEKV